MKSIVEIEHGETTCASEPGKFCRFVRADYKGRAACALYDCTLFDPDGWLLRCKPCIENQRAVPTLPGVEACEMVAQLLRVEAADLFLTSKCPGQEVDAQQGQCLVDVADYLRSLHGDETNNRWTPSRDE